MPSERGSLTDLVREAGLLASDAVMAGVVSVAERDRRPARDAGVGERDDRGDEKPVSRPVADPQGERRRTAADTGARAALGAPARVLSHAGGTLTARAVGAVIARVDVNAVIDRVDVQRIVERIDVDEVVQRVDVDRVVDSVDPNRLLTRVDIDEVVDRVEVGEIAADVLDEIDIGEIIRDSTATIGSDAVEGFRYQAMVADDLLAHLVDRVLRRSKPRRTALDVRQG